MTTDPTPPIKAHVFTDVSQRLFLKQSPGWQPSAPGVDFTFGEDIPAECEVLIVFNRASYSLPTVLPRERTVFIAAEPDVIHNYSCRFLNQFGTVLTTTHKELDTEKWWRSTCWYWFAGMDFGQTEGHPGLRGHDWFTDLPCPPKSDKISIVTSTKVHTDYHRKRLRFVETLIDRIPEHLDVYGRGFQSIGDKADAMLPNRYHLAIENGEGPHSWTEKLVDPWLCWAFPFYAGCSNVTEYFPAGAFDLIDLANPAVEADRMIREIQNGRWDKAQADLAEARRRVLEQHNLMVLLAELARHAARTPLTTRLARPRFIWSERSLLPEPGCRGNMADWLFRNSLILLDPQIELKTANLRHWRDVRRSKRRAKKLAKLEKTRQ